MQRDLSTMKVGVVGCGRVAEYHLRFLAARRDVEIIGVVDINPEAALAVGAKYNVGKIYNDVAGMLEAGQPAVVHIVTPPREHYPQARAALLSGAHVLIEKPLALNTRETVDLYNLAAQKRLSICPDFIQLYHPCMQQAIALIESGHLGRVVHCEANLTFDINLREVREAQGLHWSYELPCGIFHNYITHPLYLVLNWVGRPKRVIVSPRSFGSLPQGLTDHMDIVVEGEEITGRIVVSFVARPRAYYVRIFCEKGSVLVDFETLLMTVEQPSRLPRAVSRVSTSFGLAYHVLSGTIGNITGTLRKNVVPYQGLRTLIDRYYESLRMGKESPISAGLALAVAEAEEAIQTQTGKLRLDLSQRPSRQMDIPRPERLLLTGATGHLGSELVSRLVDSRYYVRAMVRALSRTDQLEKLGVEITFGDTRDKAALIRAATGIHTIIHVAAALRGTKSFILDTCVKGVENVAEAAKANGVKRVIYVSSLSVYDYNAIRNSSTITEFSPLDDHPEQRGVSSMGKRQAEGIALSHLDDQDTRWTILRPAAFFGNGHKLPAALGFPVGRLLIVLGTGRRRLRLIHVADVAESILRVIDHPESTQGRLFLVAHQDGLTVREYLNQCLAKSSPKRFRAILSPYWIAFAGVLALRGFRRIIRKGPSFTLRQLKYLYSSVEVDSSPIREATGWTCMEGLTDQLSAELRDRQPAPRGMPKDVAHMQPPS